MKHLKLTNKITALFLTMVMLLPLASGVMALSPEAPCLLYGNDPDKGNIYETYGDTYFLDKCPVKTPSKILYINLNNKAIRSMINEAEMNGYDSLSYIITEEYFPEFEIDDMYSPLMDATRFEQSKSFYLSEYEPSEQIAIHLKNYSKEAVINGLKALAYRIDIDIEQAFSISYDLNDVSNALKYIAGWGIEYFNSHYDYARNGSINLLDVSCMLKVIAGWDDVVERDDVIIEEI